MNRFTASLCSDRLCRSCCSQWVTDEPWVRTPLAITPRLGYTSRCAIVSSTLPCMVCVCATWVTNCNMRWPAHDTELMFDACHRIRRTELHFANWKFANSSVDGRTGMHVFRTNRALTVLVSLQPPINTKWSDADAASCNLVTLPLIISSWTLTGAEEVRADWVGYFCRW